MTNKSIRPGTLLIAPPAVQGTFWTKSVILLTEHHEHGSLGLMLNKRSTITIQEFAQQCGVELDIPGQLYMGGPVNTKSFCMLHSNEWTSANTMQVNSRLSISSTPTLLKDLQTGEKPMFYRLFVGLCGWAPDQLMSEYLGHPPFNHNKSWLTFASNYDIIFKYDSKEQWTNALEQCGQEFAQNLL